jgi:NAD(P)-dependent dehydrogenase (short-subunit alcohol dehydrogenase family)
MVHHRVTENMELGEREMVEASNAPFAGASAIIFGGAKGIGKAIAREWAMRGARVAVADIDEAAARDTAAEIAGHGGAALGLQADVLSQESMEAAAREANAHFGATDIVMNNVGAILNGHPLDIPEQEWRRIFELNYFSIVRSNAIFLPAMLARGSGHVVNTASFAGLYPYAAGRIPYASSKAAVISMSENLALLLEPQGVRVSCLVPGPVMTSIAAGMKDWTPDLPMYGPGSETALMDVGEVAKVLSDGMRDGRILIPSDPIAFEIIARRAEDPDAFTRRKIAAFASGDVGMPKMPG